MLVRRTRAAMLFVLVALFSIGASVPLACCASVADSLHAAAGRTEPDPMESHCGGGGGSCCDRAATDPVARHCCQGGDSFERPQSDSFAAPMLVTTVDAVAEPILLDSGPSLVAPSARDPIPRLEPLYTLHASLLI